MGHSKRAAPIGRNELGRLVADEYVKEMTRNRVDVRIEGQEGVIVKDIQLRIFNDEIIRHRQLPHWESTKEYYDGKSRRLLAAAMAKSFGHDRLDHTHKITRMNKASIRLGINQLNTSQAHLNAGLFWFSCD
jgi:hypothetical protein